MSPGFEIPTESGQHWYVREVLDNFNVLLYL